MKSFHLITPAADGRYLNQPALFPTQDPLLLFQELQVYFPTIHFAEQTLSTKPILELLHGLAPLMF